MGNSLFVHGTGMKDQISNASRLVVVGCVRVVAPDPMIWHLHHHVSFESSPIDINTSLFLTQHSVHRICEQNIVDEGANVLIKPLRLRGRIFVHVQQISLRQSCKFNRHPTPSRQFFFQYCTRVSSLHSNQRAIYPCMPAGKRRLSTQAQRSSSFLPCIFLSV
jgi:hypothetical protein